MKRTVFAILAAVVFVFSIGYYFKHASFQKDQSPQEYLGDDVEVSASTSSKETSVVGVLRESGLRPEEKTALGLDFSTYQVERDVANSDQAASFNGIYLATEQVDPSLLGKCVKVVGDVKKGWEKIPTDLTLNGQYTYNRVAYLSTGIQEVDSSMCNPYQKEIEVTLAGDKKLSFSGVLQRFSRPVPDIGYDYEIKLDESYDDPFDASGLTQKKDTIVLIPATNALWQQVEENMNKKIIVEGFMRWGFAESRFLEATSLNPQ